MLAGPQVSEWEGELASEDTEHTSPGSGRLHAPSVAVAEGPTPGALVQGRVPGAPIPHPPQGQPGTFRCQLSPQGPKGPEPSAPSQQAALAYWKFPCMPPIPAFCPEPPSPGRSPGPVWLSVYLTLRPPWALDLAHKSPASPSAPAELSHCLEVWSPAHPPVQCARVC